MRTANGGQSRFRASIHGPGPEPKPCKRGCCWSPFGHSTVNRNEWTQQDHLNGLKAVFVAGASAQARVEQAVRE